MCKIFVALNFRGCVKFSWSLLFIFVVKKFRALNFRGLGQQRNFFNNENFPIYGNYDKNIITAQPIVYTVYISRGFCTAVLLVWGSLRLAPFILCEEI